MNRSAGIPKVSVCVITYNQEAFIGECLESIVSQKTDFAFEVIVGDDCSTDDTPRIVRDFAARYPDIIKPIFQEKNINLGCNNYRVTHRAATGEYIAHMDGDDVMLPGKLQAQSDFLDANPSCSMVAHKAYVITGKEISQDAKSLIDHPQISDIYRLMRLHNFFTHSSKMYRRCATPAKSCVDEPLFIDFGLHLEHASWGPIGFINKPYVLYRKSPNSHTQSTGERLYLLIDQTLKAYEIAGNLGVNSHLLGRHYSNYAFKSAIFCLERNDPIGFYRYIKRSTQDTVAVPSVLQKSVGGINKMPWLQIAIGKAMLTTRPAMRFMRNRFFSKP